MDYNEHIRCAENAIEKLTNLSEEKRTQYEKLLDDIKRRKNDPFLNVALIGDFSTGKSTFINAMIKQNILKTSWQATTAVPTYIYYHEKDSLTVRLEFVDGKEYDLSRKYDKTTVENILNRKLPENMKDLITFLTTSNDFAARMKRIKVYCKSDEAFQDICIVDTPGVNPGASDTKSHVMATRDVLREYADATIVLFQAQNVFTNSFKTFLEENANHFMDEAIFVITMMDVVDWSERAEIIDFVRRSLKETFCLSNPPVFGCCAKYVNEKNVSGEKQEWCLEFDRLRNELTNRINRRRKHIIEKQISVLLKNLLRPLEQDIKGNIAKIERKLQILEKNSIENLEKELFSNELVYRHQIEKECEEENFEEKYNKMFSNIIASATNSINICTKINGNGNHAISGYMRSGLPIVMEQEQNKLSDEVNQRFARTEKILQEYYNKNKEVFEKYSVNLGKTNNIVVEDGKVDSDVMNLENVAFNGDSDSLIGVGLALGVVVTGAVVALPLAVLDGFLDTDISGTVMNAAIGISDGLMNLFGDLNAKKKEAIGTVIHSVSKMRDENREKFLQQIRIRKKLVTGSMNKIESKFKDEYQSIYQRKHQDFLTEKAGMEREIETNQKIHQKLTACLAGMKGL